MPAPKKTRARVAAGIIFLALAGLSLRPLGFLRHYACHLIHLGSGRMDAARVSLYRALHFNNAPGLLTKDSRDQIMDDVLIRAARDGNVREIRNYPSAAFPRTGFEKRFHANPWYRALIGKSISPANWDVLDRAGFRLLADSRANPIIVGQLEDSTRGPSPPWNRHLSTLARLKGNSRLAARLVGKSEILAGVILTGPELSESDRDHFLLNSGINREDFSKRWRLTSRNPATGGMAERLANGLVLLAAPGSAPGRTTLLSLRRKYMENPGRFRLEIDYLADLGTGRLYLSTGPEISTLEDTAGKWTRRGVIFSTSGRFPVKVVLRGGGLAVIAAIRLFRLEAVRLGSP